MIASRVPAIPASVAALVMIAGLGLIYFSLTGLGLLKSSRDTGVSGTNNASGSNVIKSVTTRATPSPVEG